jgi:ribose 1,5-bisphosphate isomerase
MDHLHNVAANIKSLKIQGAENVAKAAILAWEKAKDKNEAEKILKRTRPTEPMLRNSLKYLSKYGDSASLLKMISEADAKIARYGRGMIPNNSIVYTHCHSSTVVSILVAAKASGRRFAVNLTETRPDLQGRITANNLSRHGIPVSMYVDSAAMQAMKAADIMLIGADVITSYGSAINKIGSGLFSKIAHELEIPVYVATSVMKFDPATELGKREKIESRSPRSVWNVHSKRIHIVNKVFEEVEASNITAFITEFGVIKAESVLNELHKHYAWMFE